ncbi:MAG: DUF1638 domain-containing protein [Victivallales bacterium]|nr:DUF1638 domain-containing protein [Victivallales bacterium]
MIENTKTNALRLLVIACEIFAREIYFRAATSKNIVDIHLLPQGLHDIGEAGMSGELQETIDATDSSKYDALLLGYGLCNNGIRGVHAPITMVIPRAHDCISLLMGSRKMYQTCFNANPGVYYRSPGWIERGEHHLSNKDSTTAQMGFKEYDDYVEMYGEENAKYLMETLEGGLNHYDTLAYIDTGVVGFPEYVESERKIAAERKWKFDLVKGSTELFRRMLDGEWNDEDFLVLPPGEHVAPSNDDSVIAATRCGTRG